MDNPPPLHRGGGTKSWAKKIHAGQMADVLCSERAVRVAAPADGVHLPAVHRDRRPFDASSNGQGRATIHSDSKHVATTQHLLDRPGA